MKKFLGGSVVGFVIGFVVAIIGAILGGYITFEDTEEDTEDFEEEEVPVEGGIEDLEVLEDLDDDELDPDACIIYEAK